VGVSAAGKILQLAWLSKEEYYQKNTNSSPFFSCLPNYRNHQGNQFCGDNNNGVTFPTPNSHHRRHKGRKRHILDMMTVLTNDFRNQAKKLISRGYIPTVRPPRQTAEVTNGFSRARRLKQNKALQSHRPPELLCQQQRNFTNKQDRNKRTQHIQFLFKNLKARKHLKTQARRGAKYRK
jgi:hypothetical protein